MTDTAYIITQGEYSDYEVLAVFSNRELAEAALPAYTTFWNEPKIEERPLNPTFPAVPDGLSPYNVRRYPDGIICAEACALCELDPKVPRQYERCLSMLETGVFARNKDHAIKIAAERFAQYDAREAGIA